jgi:hypothetical protein
MMVNPGVPKILTNHYDNLQRTFAVDPRHSSKLTTLDMY